MTSFPNRWPGSRCREPRSLATGTGSRPSPRSWHPPIRSMWSNSGASSISMTSSRSGRSSRSSTSGTVTPPTRTTTSSMPPRPTACSDLSPGAPTPRPAWPPTSAARSRPAAPRPRSQRRPPSPTVSTSPLAWPTATGGRSKGSSTRCGARMNCSPRSIASSTSSRPCSEDDRPARPKRWKRSGTTSVGAVENSHRPLRHGPPRPHRPGGAR